MAADDMVLVTGASGRTGQRVIAALADRKIRVRAFVRRESSGNDLVRAGAAQFVCGDLENSDDIVRAVHGCGKIIHICPPMHHAEDRIAKAMIACAENSGVNHFILYSVLHPVINVPHHRRKLAAEEALIESGLQYTILQPGRYMQHLNGIWNEVRHKGVHAMPFSTSTCFSLTDLDDLAQAAALIATQDHHFGATYQLAGPQALSQEDCARILSDLLGTPVHAQRRDPQLALEAATKAGWPDSRIENMRIMNAHYDACGLEGNSNVLRWLLGREPTDFAAFVKRELLAH